MSSFIVVRNRLVSRHGYDPKLGLGYAASDQRADDAISCVPTVSRIVFFAAAKMAPAPLAVLVTLDSVSVEYHGLRSFDCLGPVGPLCRGCDHDGLAFWPFRRPRRVAVGEYYADACVQALCFCDSDAHVSAATAKQPLAGLPLVPHLA